MAKQLYLARVLGKNSLWAKMTPKYFFSFEKFDHWFLLEIHSLSTELYWLYSFFLYWFLPYGLQSRQIILKKFIFEFPKNMIKPLCRRVLIKSFLFNCLSVSLSIHLWHTFLRIYQVDFRNFLHEDILPYTL